MNYKKWKGDSRRIEWSLEELKEFICNSTLVVNWYPHCHDDQEGFKASVRGPHNRWLKVTKGNEDSIASASNDANYCAAAMNSLPFLIEQVESLRKENTVMREALEFYADRRSWTIDYHSYMEEREDVQDGEFAQTIREDCDDISPSNTNGGYGGKRARQALSEVENE